MADLPKLRSKEQILGELITSFLAKVPDVNDFNRGSVLLQFFSAIAQQNFKAAADVISMIDALSVDRATGEALQRLAADANISISSGTYSSTRVNITDTSFTKKMTNVFAGQPAPVAGSLVVYVNDASKLPSTGSIYIGRGTSNVEGPLNYISASSQSGGAYWAINLASNSPTTKFHNTGETVTLSQGGKRTIGSGTIAKTLSSSNITSVSFKTTATAIIPDGETTAYDIPVSCLELGTNGNVPRGSIKVVEGLPFPAGAFNPNAANTGLPPDDDDTLRDKIKLSEQTKSKGTEAAIKFAALGIISSDDLKTVQSANIIKYANNKSALIVDDGTGYQPIYNQTGIETIVSEALGGEKELQLRQYPIAGVRVFSLTQAPFAIYANYFLSIEIQGVTTTHYFQAEDFKVQGKATAYEIISSINGNSNINFSAITAENGTKIAIFPRDSSKNSMRVINSDGYDSNQIFNFPTDNRQTLLLYKNDILLYQDGVEASVYSLNKGLWNTSITSGDTLSYIVDGTPEITISLTQDIFRQFDITSTPSSSTNINTWIKVLNYLMTGVEVSILGEQVKFSSARGTDNSASIHITGGTLKDKIFTIGENLYSKGQTSDYILNTQTGQIGLKNSLTYGDTVTAGSSFSRANININSISNGPGSDGNIWLIVDGSTSFLSSGIDSNTLLKWEKQGDIITIKAETSAGQPTGFKDVNPGDWFLIWTETTDEINNPEMYKYRGYWRVESSKVGEITVNDSGNVRPAGSSSKVNIPVDRLVIARSLAPMQKFSFTAGNISSFISQVSNLLSGVEAEIIGGSVKLLTVSAGPEGELAFAAADSAGKTLEIPTLSIFKNISSQKAYVATKDNQFNVPSFTWSTFPSVLNGVQISQPDFTDLGGDLSMWVSTVNSENIDTNNLNHSAISDYDYSSGIITLSPPSYMTSSQAPVQSEGRFYYQNSYHFSDTDTAVLVIDDTPETKTYTLPVARSLTVNENSSPTLFSFSANDAESSLDLNNPASFAGFNFSNWKVWRQAKNNFTDGTYGITFSSNSYGPTGNSQRVGIFYPSSLEETSLQLKYNITSMSDIEVVLPVTEPRVTNIDQTTSWTVDVKLINLSENVPQISTVGSGPFLSGGSLTVKASLIYQNIKYTAKTVGTSGNNIQISYLDFPSIVPGYEEVLAGPTYVTVKIKSGVSTASQILNAVKNSSPASAVVDVELIQIGASEEIKYTYRVGSEPLLVSSEVQNGDVAILNSSLDFLENNKGINAKVQNVSETSFSIIAPQGTGISDNLIFSKAKNVRRVLTVETTEAHNILSGHRLGIWNTGILTNTIKPINGVYYPTIIDSTKFTVTLPDTVPGGYINNAIRSGTQVTANTASPHGLYPGSVIIVSDFSDPTYNGTATVQTTPTSNSFTYIRSGLSGSASGGWFDFQSYGAVPSASPTISSIIRSSSSETNVTLSGPHGLSIGDVVTINGTDLSAWDPTVSYATGSIISYLGNNYRALATTSAAVKASQIIQDLKYTAAIAGSSGNGISIIYNDTSSSLITVAVNLLAKEISVEFKSDNTKALEIKNAVDAYNTLNPTLKLVDVAVIGVSTDFQTSPLSQTYLQNGSEETPSLTPSKWILTSQSFNNTYIVSGVADLPTNAFTFIYEVNNGYQATIPNGGGIVKLSSQGALARSVGNSSSLLSFAKAQSTAQEIIDGLNEKYSNVLHASVTAGFNSSDLVSTSTLETQINQGFLQGSVLNYKTVNSSRLVYLTITSDNLVEPGSTIKCSGINENYNGTYEILTSASSGVKTWLISVQSKILATLTQTYTLTSSSYIGYTALKGLLDGENYINESNLAAASPFPQFTLKHSYNLIPEIDENLKLVAYNNNQLSSFLNKLVVSGLANVADISLANYGKNLQIMTNTFGSSGSVQITGGTANSNTVAIIGSGTEVDNKVSLASIPYSLRSSFNKNDWVLLSQTVLQNKQLKFSNSTKLRVPEKNNLVIEKASTFIQGITFVAKKFGLDGNNVNIIFKLNPSYSVAVSGNEITVNFVNSPTATTVSDVVSTISNPAHPAYPLITATNTQIAPVASTNLTGGTAFNKASVNIQNITYTAKQVGIDGNSISINYIPGAIAGSEIVSVSGTSISVRIESGESTPANIISKISTSIDAAALVDVNLLNTSFVNQNKTYLNGGSSGTFQTKRNISANNVSKFQLQKHGSFTALIRIGGPSVNFSSRGVKEGDWIRLANTPSLDYSNLLEYDPGTKASRIIQDLKFESKSEGTGGNSISIEYVNGAVLGSETIQVTENKITIKVASGSTTANSIKSLIESYNDAQMLLNVVVIGSGTNAQTAPVGEVFLTGGINGDTVKAAGINFVAMGESGPVSSGRIPVSPTPSKNWDYATTYLKNESVLYSGKIYRLEDSLTSQGQYPTDGAPWKLIWEIREWNTSNVGIHQVVRVFGEDTVYLDGVNFAEEVLLLGNETNLSIYSHDSVMPGDTLIISGTVLGTFNTGRYSVIESPYFPTEDKIYINPLNSTHPAVVLSESFNQVNVEQQKITKAYKKILSVGPSGNELQTMVFDTPNLTSRFTSSNGAYVKALGKLDYTLEASFGIDAYKNYEGMIKAVNRVIYGDPTNPDKYPGIRAAGTSVDISSPLVRRVTLSVAVRLKTGIPFSSVRENIKAAAAGYINNLKIGESIALSKVIEAISKVQGITSVVITSPTYTSASDRVFVANNEKALVLDPTNDITVSILS